MKQASHRNRMHLSLIMPAIVVLVLSVLALAGFASEGGEGAHHVDTGKQMKDFAWRVLDFGALLALVIWALKKANVKGTLAARQADIEKALSKYVREPVVTVVVTQFTGPATEQIRVIGEAAKPQILPYRKNMTLLDVMIAVGGLTPFADGNSATISRTADGGKSYSVRLRDLVIRGDISANVEMRPGDILIIPQSWF